jgi:hypothetical protein
MTQQLQKVQIPNIMQFLQMTFDMEEGFFTT